MLNASVLTPSSLQPLVCRLVSWHFMPGMICLFIWEEQLQRAGYYLAELLWWKSSSGDATTAYLNKYIQRTSAYCGLCLCKVCIRMLTRLFVCVLVRTGYSLYGSSRSHCELFACRCTEQPFSSMSLTQRRTCLSVSAHSSACQAVILDLMGPGMFTATRASVCSPTGPSSSPSGAFWLSSTDTPSLDHMPCLLKS